MYPKQTSTCLLLLHVDMNESVYFDVFNFAGLVQTSFEFWYDKNYKLMNESSNMTMKGLTDLFDQLVQQTTNRTMPGGNCSMQEVLICKALSIAENIFVETNSTIGTPLTTLMTTNNTT
jgi:hypothetical protein